MNTLSTTIAHADSTTTAVNILPITYVHEGVEVKKTGRTATRQINVPGERGVSRSIVLSEIVPVEDENLWKKWVDPTLLYVVK